ncbi:conserved hypothetical protein [Aeromicrobium sp. 9AM]|nr:conserved hypothetical protein [Aeromicrobium sp. 9AM]
MGGMYYVMTIDQRRSQAGPDAVPAAEELLAGSAPVRAFERTAGDEIQGLLDDPGGVVDLTLALARTRTWSIGIGIGDVETPLADSVRANRGEAFVAARRAVERAKSSPVRTAVEGHAAEHAETALVLLLTIVERRSEAGWEAVDAMTTSATQAEAAAKVGISPQAMNRRLRVAGYVEEQRGKALAVHLLGELS